MKKNLLLGLGLLLLAAAGCAHRSRVILLDSGRPTAVVVDTGEERVVLDRSNTGAEFKLDDPGPVSVHKISTAEIKESYGRLLRSQPPVPVSFLLYFKPGSLELVGSSWQVIPEIEKTIQERKPCDVSIYGYADRVGSRAYNERLSQRRARKIFNLLRRAGVELENVDIQFYGEEMLLVPTPDGVAEQKNRRVEVQVR